MCGRGVDVDSGLVGWKVAKLGGGESATAPWISGSGRCCGCGLEVLEKGMTGETACRIRDSGMVNGIPKKDTSCL